MGDKANFAEHYRARVTAKYAAMALFFDLAPTGSNVLVSVLGRPMFSLGLGGMVGTPFLEVRFSDAFRALDKLSQSRVSTIFLGEAAVALAEWEAM